MVTRADGRLAVGRLGALCEQVNIERREGNNGKDGIFDVPLLQHLTRKGMLWLTKLLICFE